MEKDGGKMVLVSDADFIDWGIPNTDNRLLANNVFAWMAIPVYGDVPWLSEMPTGATISGHSAFTTTLGFDTSELSPGVYSATLALEHNDPAQNSPLLISVHFNVVLAPEYGVSLAPQDQAGEGAPGTVVSYAFAITNQGNVNDSFTLQAGGVWATSLSAANSGPLAPGESFTVTLEVTIPPGAADGQADTSTLTVTSTADPQVSDMVHAVTMARVTQVALALGPLSQSGQGLRGEMLVYPYTLTNLGQATDSFDLAVDAAWSAELSALSSGPLAPGESFEFTLSVTIPAGAPGGSSDTAAITAASSLDPQQSALAQVTTTAIQAGGGLAAQTQAASGLPGETVVYTFVVQNNGSHSDSFSLAVDAAWSAELSALSSGSLAPGESFEFTLSVTIPALAPGGSHDTAVITAASSLDPQQSALVQATTTALRAGVGLAAQTQAASGAPGEMVVYTFVVRNNGSHADTFALSAAGTWASQLPASSGLLASGETFTVTLRVTIPADAADGSTDETTLTVTSGLDGSVSGSTQVTTTALVPGWDLYLPVIEK